MWLYFLKTIWDRDKVTVSSLTPRIPANLVHNWFLADRTIGRAYGTVCRLSVVCLSVCNVLYCGKTVRPSQKVSEGVNRKPGSKSSFFGRRHISTSGFVRSDSASFSWVSCYACAYTTSANMKLCFVNYHYICVQFLDYVLIPLWSWLTTVLMW